ncbi:uncharacterized protein LOC116061900 isoform X1 [Sander lucioperca]|uniref:uncharacterized protein LOC116061900 isoform X1 n=2 Tax=Sander lucioperca TaxID=283035 RepID=UPI0016538B1B|nr:uncharacterized protein LOC116061900 isoform X1 [Sander lucioperca]
MCDVRKTIRGTFLAVDQTCHRCEFNRQWKSQPFIGSTPAGNIHLSAAVYFTGTSFIQMKKVFNAFGVRSMRYQAFGKHAKTYLEPAIVWKWKRAQQVELQSLSQQSKVIIGGDMRADSPGHCAKFGSYTVMNLETSTVIDIQLVQSNEVGGSYYMEKEGLKRSLALLEASGVTLDCIVTDRHLQIQKYLREKGITQYYDVWHIDKGMSKNIDKLAKEKDCEVVKKWQQSIRNHLYWTASSSKTGPEKVAKWTSVINHIHNIHTHEDPLFPKCEHSDVIDKRRWLKPGSKASYRLEKVLTNKRFIEGVEKLSPHHQTSSLEAFHSVVIRFAPKSVVYPFIGMLCRLYLSAFHFNENANRPQSTSALGGPAFKLAFPKAKKGGYSLKRRKIEPTFCYVNELIALTFESVVPDPAPLTEELQKITIPEDLCAEFSVPSMEEAIAGFVSRFNPAQVENQLRGASQSSGGPTTSTTVVQEGATAECQMAAHQEPGSVRGFCLLKGSFPRHCRTKRLLLGELLGLCK